MWFNSLVASAGGKIVNRARQRRRSDARRRKARATIMHGRRDRRRGRPVAVDQQEDQAGSRSRPAARLRGQLRRSSTRAPRPTAPESPRTSGWAPLPGGRRRASRASVTLGGVQPRRRRRTASTRSWRSRPRLPAPARRPAAGRDEGRPAAGDRGALRRPGGRRPTRSPTCCASRSRTAAARPVTPGLHRHLAGDPATRSTRRPASTRRGDRHAAATGSTTPSTEGAAVTQLADAPPAPPPAQTAEARPSRAHRAQRPARRPSASSAWLLCAPAVIVMLLVTGYPIVYAFWLSLQRADLRFPDATKFVGLDNYVDGAQLEPLVAGRPQHADHHRDLGRDRARARHAARAGRCTARSSGAGSSAPSMLVPYGIVTVVAAFAWQFAFDAGDRLRRTRWLGTDRALAHRARRLALRHHHHRGLEDDAVHGAAAARRPRARARRAATRRRRSTAPPRGSAFRKITLPLMKPAHPRRGAVPHARRVPHLRHGLHPDRGRQQHRDGVDPRATTSCSTG